MVNKLKVKSEPELDFKSTMARTNQCLFCGANRLLGHGEKAWNSVFRIQIGYYTQRSFTICPKCRKRKINDIYEELIEELSKSWEKYEPNLKL